MSETEKGLPSGFEHGRGSKASAAVAYGAAAERAAIVAWLRTGGPSKGPDGKLRDMGGAVIGPGLFSSGTRALADAIEAGAHLADKEQP